METVRQFLSAAFFCAGGRAKTQISQRPGRVIANPGMRLWELPAIRSETIEKEDSADEITCHS